MEAWTTACVSLIVYIFLKSEVEQMYRGVLDYLWLESGRLGLTFVSKASAISQHHITIPILLK